MDTPGIEVQSAASTMTGDLGENSFNEVFFTDVRVPRRQRRRHSAVEGWEIANTYLLRHERAIAQRATTQGT